MMLDMNTELQHLISISMEKMTSEASSSLAGRGNRKAGRMDLRKALLVAHFLQEVRQAYYDENYEIVAKTFSNFENTNEYDNSIYREPALIKADKERHKEETLVYFMDSDLPPMPTSTSAYPSCVTNADVMVSRISQITTPLSVSVNTSYVVCCQNLDQVGLKEKTAELPHADDDDVPVFCGELEVSSCCEVSSDEEGVSNPEVNSHDHVTLLNGNEKSSDIVLTKWGSSADARTNPDHNNTLYGAAKAKEVVTCPLPRKKRPFPKEFLDETTSLCKSPKTLPDALNVRSFQGQDITNTLITSVTDTVTLKSNVSLTLSTISSVTQSKTFSVNQTENFQPSPKVVVQLTQSCDSYQPITCTQLYLEKRLNNLTADSF